MMTLRIFCVAALLPLSGCFDGNSQGAGNASPVPQAETLFTETETAIVDRLSASDKEGDTLSFSLASAASLGEVVIASDGDFTYTPDDEATGMDSFSFAVSDGVNDPVIARVSITIEPLQVSFAGLSRQAFGQLATDNPVLVGGREFVQDSTDPNAYDDLLID